MLLSLKKSIFMLLGLAVIQTYFNICSAETIVSFRHQHAVEKHYQHSALILALEKTVSSHGTFTMKYIKEPMNDRRARAEILKNNFPNFVMAMAGSAEKFIRFSYAPFPIELGLLGYRLPMHHKSNLSTFSKIKTLNELKSLRVVQGEGWHDSQILKDNGFTAVSEVNSKRFGKMLTSNRVDLFFSSLSDINYHLSDTIVLNKKFAIFYSSPRFYIANKNNTAIIERIYKGLTLAFNDGSLLELMDKNFAPELLKLDASNRVIFRLKSEHIKTIDNRYFEWLNKLDPYVNTKR